MKIVVTGPEGSGKSTQAELLAEDLGVPLISAGPLVRAELKKDTPLGRRIKAVVEQGGYLTDQEINGIVIPELERVELTAGFVMEGYPRRLGQAVALEQLLTKKGLRLDKVIYLDLDEKTILERLTKRGRFDDTPKQIKGRLKDFYQGVREVRSYYQKKGIWTEVDARPSIKEVFTLVQEAIKR